MCDYTGKQSFAPHIEYYFDAPLELSLAFGHKIKEKPEDMGHNVYMSHVFRRIKTFTGKWLRVVVVHYREERLDDFGDTEKRVGRVNMIGMEYEYEYVDVVDRRMRFESRHKVDANVAIDWSKIHDLLYNVL